jgi:tRNA (adenine22-N1)-methyltransferase
LLSLRERLAMLASFVPQGARIADIGTDHAYLPIELVSKRIVDFSVAGEVNPGPYQSANESIARLGLQDRISLRFGDGLAVVEPGEVDTVVIAGMGGNTIIEILTKRQEVTCRLKRLILQPMVAAPQVRRWLVKHAWEIVDEGLCREDGKLYEIIVAERGSSREMEQILYDIGPVLWQKQSELLPLHLQLLIEQNKRVLRAMAQSEEAQLSEKHCEYAKRLKELEEKQKCLSSAR